MTETSRVSASGILEQGFRQVVGNLSDSQDKAARVLLSYDLDWRRLPGRDDGFSKIFCARSGINAWWRARQEEEL
jgi:hypothetical protein